MQKKLKASKKMKHAWSPLPHMKSALQKKEWALAPWMAFSCDQHRCADLHAASTRGRRARLAHTQRITAHTRAKDARAQRALSNSTVPARSLSCLYSYI